MSETVKEYMDRTAAPPLTLTLYQIETGLAELLEYRAMRLADTSDPPKQEELDAIEGEIRRYEFATPAKVSGVAAIFRRWRDQRGAAKGEIRRLQMIVATFEAMEVYLKARVAEVLERLPAPKMGARKLIGTDGSTLMLKGNGGLEPLQVDGWSSELQRWSGVTPSPLPNQYRLATVTMPYSLYLAMANVEVYRERIGLQGTVPNGARIREALAKDCAVCRGTGLLLEKLPERISDEAIDAGAACEQRECDACDKGKQIVPGARLLPRGSHVEIR